FFSSRRRHTRSTRDWSSDVCSSDLFHSFPHFLYSTATRKLLCIQSPTHTFYLDGGCPPSGRIPDLTIHLWQFYSSSFFYTLAHSFAVSKMSTPLFSIDSALFAQNTRGWGYPASSDNGPKSLCIQGRMTLWP